jgi:hypothetical protein
MNNQTLVLKGYGVTLKRLTHDKIELVRNWRNDPKIQQTMFFQDYITPEMQEKWFSRINNENNYYFIVAYNDEEIGLINIKDIDYEKKTGETGVFIYEDRYLGTDISYRAHLVMFDYVFNVLNFTPPPLPRGTGGFLLVKRARKTSKYEWITKEKKEQNYGSSSNQTGDAFKRSIAERFAKAECEYRKVAGD